MVPFQGSKVLPVKRVGKSPSSVSCLPAGLIIVLGLLAVSGGTPRKRNDPGQLTTDQCLSFMGTETRLGDNCIVFEGTLRSGSKRGLEPSGPNFFHGLKRSSSPSGPVFRNGSHVFTEYPDEVSFYVGAWGSRCSKDYRYIAEWPTPTPEFVKGLHAEAGYVRELRLRPLEVNLAEEGSVEIRERTYWQYHFVMETKGVRLTEPLVINLLSKDGTRMAQFVVDLAGRTHLC